MFIWNKNIIKKIGNLVPKNKIISWPIFIDNKTDFFLPQRLHPDFQIFKSFIISMN